MAPAASGCCHAGLHTIQLTDHEAGQRLDRYLRKLLPTVPLGAIFKHLRTGAIRVDGKKARPDLRLVAGMSVVLRLPEADLARAAGGDPTSAPEPAAGPRTPPKPRVSRGPEPRVVYEDADVLVVDKPAGLAAQPGSGQQDDLVAWLDRTRRGVRTAIFRPAPAHRLDRGTSGLVAIGLSPAGQRGLTAAFRDGEVEKVYLAIVHGVPEPRRGSIDAPLAVQEGAAASHQKAVVAADGKPAHTDYEVLQVVGERALVRLVPHTGRLHQIRAHLAHLGHPIVGDRRYGAPSDLGRGVFLLHAAELELPLPKTGVRRRFLAPPPALFGRHMRGE